MLVRVASGDEALAKTRLLAARSAGSIYGVSAGDGRPDAGSTDDVSAFALLIGSDPDCAVVELSRAWAATRQQLSPQHPP